MFEYVEIYSEEFYYLNNTLIKENNNDYELSELILFMDNYTNSLNQEKCLSLELGQNQRAFINPEHPQFIDDLYKKGKIYRRFQTLKFEDNYNGFLIIGNKPHEYENNTLKYNEENYIQIYSESFLNYFRIQEIKMKEIFFYNRSKDKILININNQK